MSRGDIIVPHQDEIEVYVSEKGYICIKQTGWDGEECIITLQPIHVPAISKALAERVKESQESRQLWIEEGDDANS